MNAMRMSAPSKTSNDTCVKCGLRIVLVDGAWMTGAGNTNCHAVQYTPYSLHDPATVITPMPPARQRALAILDRAEGIFTEDAAGECDECGALDCGHPSREAAWDDTDDMRKLRDAVKAGDAKRVLSLLGLEAA